MADWFHRCFVDGYEWVMTANVVGMSQYADGGRMSTKPYAAGGAYINRMSDYCGGCRYDPKVRVGDRRVPVHRRLLGLPGPQRERLAGNTGCGQPLTADLRQGRRERGPGTGTGAEPGTARPLAPS